MVRQLTVEEEMVIARVGQEEALYICGLEDHGTVAWREAAFERVAANVVVDVHAATGDARYVIDGTTVDSIYLRLRNQYNRVQLKISRNEWHRGHLTVYNEQIVNQFWYLRRHQNNVEGFRNVA